MKPRVLAALLLSGGFSVCARGAGTLVGHWKFNEASGPTAFDSSANGFHGALAGSAAFVSGGIEGNAIAFSTPGGSFVDMGAIPFNGAPFSLSAWIKTTSSVHEIIAGRHVATIVQGYFLAINGGGSGGYGLPGKAYSYVSTFPGNEPISVTTVNDDQWHHLVMTHKPGGATTIFVDGRLEATRAPAYAPSGAAFMVGGLMNTAGGRISAYTGLADDVGLYEGVLTGAQICALFNNPGSPAPMTCDGDVNLDGVVNFTDLNLVLSAFGQSGACLQADADGDGQVNFTDLNIILSAFGSSC